MSKTMKELSNLNDEGLQGKLAELQKELMKDYAQVATGTIPKNPGQIRRSKRTIARILTILNQRRKQKTKA